MELFPMSIVLFCFTAGSASALQCYSCTYNQNPYGAAESCISMPANDTQPTTACPTSSSSCLLSVTLNSDNSIFTLSRGCAPADAINCCENQNSQMKCGSLCGDDLCNNATYNSTTSSISSLPRCPAPTIPGSIACNSCQYSGNPYADTSCVTSPLSPKVGFVQCPTNTSECTVKSMRANADMATVWSYERGCHYKGSMTYGQTVDSVYTTWICHCNDTAYCNDNTADGTQAECHPAPAASDQSFNDGVSQLRRNSFVTTVFQTALVALFGSMASVVRR